jgi:hypothetical protein
MTSQQPTWRDQRRLDRAAEAQIAREDRAAQAQTSITAAEAAARLKRENHAARQAGRRTARKQAAARRAERVAWLREHVTDLLFVPVIAVPAVLAWTGMSAYGSQLYGPAGIALPAFSEGAMWAFAGATTVRLNRTARDGIERPVWHLRTGAAVFAAEGAVLNFLHGLSPALGHLAGPVTGTVMALISVAGVVAHQLITAGPRRSRAERAAARAERAAGRRERAVRRIALRRATAVLDADGSAHLVYTPGRVTLTRRLGRARLEAAPSSPVWLPWPMVLPGSAEPGTALLVDVQAVEAMAAYQGWHSTFMATPSEPRQTVAPAPPHAFPRPLPVPALDPPAARATHLDMARPQRAMEQGAGTRQERAKAHRPNASRSAPKPAAGKRQNGALSSAGKRAKAEELLRANPAMTRTEVVEQSGVSARTADRIMAQMPRRLRVAK